MPPPRLWGVATIALCLVTASVATTRYAVDSFFGDSVEYCSQSAVCLQPLKCDGNSACFELQDCHDGICACRYPLPEDYVCYNLVSDIGTPTIKNSTDCASGRMCSRRGSTLMTDLMPVALTTGVCFVVAVTAMLACKMLIKRMHDANPARRLGDGDSASVSSMQRWINERLRDRPPRYEEMVSESAATPRPPPPAGPATVSGAVAEAEKPPAYEVVVNETLTSGTHYVGPIAANIPPPLYSAEAMADGPASGPMCYRNPCFLGDAEEPPPYTGSATATRSTRSASLPDPICASLFDPFEPPTAPSDSSFTASSTFDSSATSPATSIPPSSASFASASSSFPPTPSTPPAGEDLLTVSQAVALKEMMLAEGAPPAAVERAALWTSAC